MELKREVRFMQSIELRTDNGKPVIRGYAAKFNSLSHDLGGFREKISPGAFSKAITRDDVRALVGHDPDKIIGRNKAGTLSLREDDTGLYCEIEPPDTSAGRDVVQSIKRGDLDGMSFGFGTVSDDWANENGMRVRELREVKLYDVSVVTYPAYPETSVSMRSLLFPDGQPDGKKEDRDNYYAIKAAKKALAMHREDMNADDPDDTAMEQHLIEAIKQMGGDPEDLELDDDEKEEENNQALNESGNIATGGDDKTQLESREQRKRTDSAEAQLDAKRQALGVALCQRFGFNYFGPIETYDDHIIAGVYDDSYNCQYVSIPYTIDGDGAITYGEPAPVELDWVPTDRAKELAAEYRAIHMAQRNTGGKRTLTMLEKIRKMNESSAVDFEAERNKEEELVRSRRAAAIKAERDKWDVPAN